MPDYFLIIVILLFILAISDLVVGVSNDAVNFINSAVGSKVATRRTIMIVASLGIFIGASFSSGMMEVARKGIFNPELFLFNEVMIIFLAVMLTDIFLLDLFNTFGLPTSTTVSIVFELLGASVAIAFLKVLNSGEGIGSINEYINSASALAIIIGILSSVVVAFIIGSMVQYLSRLLFTFHYQKSKKWIGSIWSGIALAFLTYFLVFKGLKGASFVSKEFISQISSHLGILLLCAFLFWSILMHMMQLVFKINILRVVVLVGTFSLAMAFAGNDLVNFIGVPIAGFESFREWSASGIDANLLTMESLGDPVQTDTYLLLIAGGIMIVTLWFSKKARSVTETEVSLGRQDEGLENFSPNIFAQGIVRFSRGIGQVANAILPLTWQHKIEERFQQHIVEKENNQERPAFDLVRASVNLTVASMLIAVATSYKLPLSTTYVSFMVAMGASLADRAWGRDSAVFRVAGVINVIGGWFATAAIAFFVAGIIALLIYFFGGYAIAALVILLIFIIFRSSSIHKKRDKEKKRKTTMLLSTAKISTDLIISNTASKLSNNLSLIARIYKHATQGLLEEDRSLLSQSSNDLEELITQNEELKSKLYRSIKHIDEDHGIEAGRFYLFVFNMEQDIVQSISLIVKTCINYVDNNFNPLSKDQAYSVNTLIKKVEGYLQSITNAFDLQAFQDIQNILDQSNELLSEIENQLSEQLEGIQKNKYGMRNSMLIFSLKLETKDLVEVATKFITLYHKALNSDQGGTSIVLADVVSSNN